MTTFFCLLIGVLIFNLFRLEEAVNKHKNNSFLWKIFLTRNIFPSAIAILSGVLIILNKDAAEYWIKSIFPTFKVDGITMGLYGIVGDVFLKKIIELTKRKINNAK